MTKSLAGRRFGRYTILEELGHGDMGVVFKGRDENLGRPVAVKVLRPELAGNSTFLRAFQQEAAIAARLNHTNIASIYEITRLDRYACIVMEYVPGQSLRDVIRIEGALPAPRVARIVMQVASALDYAHGLGVVHRDVKPQNIIVTADGTAKLTDFGVASAMGDPQQASSAAIGGTVAYMSPEQLKGEPVGRPADIYSLGMVAYQALTGRLPFRANTLHSMMWSAVHDPPPPLRALSPHVSPEVEQVVMRAIDKHPQRRQATAGAFADRLARAASLPYTPQPNTVPTRTVRQRLVKFMPVFAALATLVLILAVIGLVAALSPGAEPAVTPSTEVEVGTPIETEAPTATWQRLASATPTIDQVGTEIAQSEGWAQATHAACVDATVTVIVQSLSATTDATRSATDAPTPAGAGSDATPVAAASIELLEPQDGAHVEGLVRFAWSWPVTMRPGQVFDVKICSGSGCSPLRGVTNTTESRFDWCPQADAGTFRWSVDGLDADRRRLASSPVRQFAWQGGGCP